MLARKRKRCLRVVVEFAVSPGNRVMARRTQSRHEASLRMRRTTRCGVVLCVAAVAIDRGAFELAIHVARRTGERGVCAG